MPLSSKAAQTSVAALENAPAAAPERMLRFSSAGSEPVALTWSDDKQKSALRRKWRNATIETFGSQARLLRLAWILYELSGQKGYAFASNTTLARATSMPVKKIEACLTHLERGGAIIREHVETNGRSERR